VALTHFNYNNSSPLSGGDYPPGFEVLHDPPQTMVLSACHHHAMIGHVVPLQNFFSGQQRFPPHWMWLVLAQQNWNKVLVRPSKYTLARII